MYGWRNTGNGIDTHLMKNTEWGAVTYLAKSIYGKNDEIWINPSDSYTTGCAGDNVNAGITSGCAYAYETPNGVQASTTGNTYGIYDLSGNTREYVAAYVNNTHDTLTTNASNLVNAEAKYKNVYYIGTTDTDVNNYASIISSKGDTLYETSSGGSGNNAWYSDRSYMVRTDMPVVTRGGYYGWGVNVGAFYFDRYGGGGYTYCSFRPVLIVDSGL